MNIKATLLVALLVGASGIPVGAVAAADQQTSAYSGAHVSFDTSSNAIVDYTVNDETVLESVSVQSQSKAKSQGTVGADVSLSAMTDISGSGVSVDSKTEASASVTAESGARMHAHDNAHGILVVESGGESQYVTVNLSSSAEADSQNDQRVVVTTADGTEGTFIVVGDGEVTVNERGNVSADLGSDGRLVFRSYPDGRDEDAQREEQYISEGKATAEVYVMQSAEASGELAADVVRYSEDTTVEVTQKSEGTVTMTADRTQERGTIVITSVSEQAISSADDLEVTVDGEAAAEASSYSDLESAADGGDTSKFLVRQQSSAQASADVLVAVNHFSEREVQMSDGSGNTDGSDGGNGGSGESTSTGGPGFSIGIALVALVAAALYANRRS